MKKKILVLLFGLFVFTIAGITTVQAQFNSAQVKCLPESLESGQKAKCYIIANMDTDTFGVYTRAITSQLNIKGTGTSQTISVKGLTDTVKSTSGMYTCKNITDVPTGYTAAPGCVQFESEFTASATTHPAMIKKGVYSQEASAIFSSSIGYTEIGYYEVELADTATATNCGELCVEIKYAPEYIATTSATAANDDPNISNSTAKTKTGNFPMGYACAEITPVIKGETTNNSKTGNFASYAVLIAGACIAIAAVAIATKHNKIYKV